MMSKFFKLTVTLLCLHCIAFAQYSEGIKRDAGLMINAMIVRDYKTAAAYIHPRLVAASGGIDKLAASIEASLAPMLKDSAVFDYSLGEPGDVLKTPSGWYATVPQRTIMTFKAKKVKGYEQSTLLALSLNQGKRWYFIDAGRMTESQIKQYFPAVYGKLTIKPRENPVYEHIN